MTVDGSALTDKVAVVTGGSRGIGRATVDCFAKLGADVVINYIKDERAATDAVSAAETHRVKALAVHADISRADEARHLIYAAIAHFGRIDFLVCNAGIWEAAAIDELSEE